MNALACIAVNCFVSKVPRPQMHSSTSIAENGGYVHSFSFTETTSICESKTSGGKASCSGTVASKVETKFGLLFLAIVNVIGKIIFSQIVAEDFQSFDFITVCIDGFSLCKLLKQLFHIHVSHLPKTELTPTLFVID